MLERPITASPSVLETGAANCEYTPRSADVERRIIRPRPAPTSPDHPASPVAQVNPATTKSRSVTTDADDGS